MTIRRRGQNNAAGFIVSVHRGLSRLLLLVGLLAVPLGAAAQPLSPEALSAAETYRLVLPSGAASVEITLPTKYVVETDVRPDPFGRYVAGTLSESDIAVSLNVIGGLGQPTAERCALDRLRILTDSRRIPPDQEIRIDRNPDKTIFAYLSQGEAVPRYHEWGFLATGDACIVLHLSKPDPSTSDLRTIATVLGSMIVRKTGEPAK